MDLTNVEESFSKDAKLMTGNSKLGIKTRLESRSKGKHEGGVGFNLDLGKGKVYH